MFTFVVISLNIGSKLEYDTDNRKSKGQDPGSSKR